MSLKLDKSLRIAAILSLSFLIGSGCSAVPSREKKEAYIRANDKSPAQAQMIRKGRVWIGASWRDVHAAKGLPENARNTRIGNGTLLTVMEYPCKNLYFRDGTLEMIQDSVRCSVGTGVYPPPAMPYPRFGRR